MASTGIATTIVNQLGDVFFTSVGATKMAFKDSGRPLKASACDDNAETISFETGITFMVPGKKKIIVAYEPDDTYSVYLYQMYDSAMMIRTNRMGRVLDDEEFVYADQLADVIKDMLA